jgi:guanidinopropionase
MPGAQNEPLDEAFVMSSEFLPVDAMQMPRFAGIPTFMRLRHVDPTDTLLDQVDIGMIGIPWDGGTTNRPGARHGPRQIRDASTMIRRIHPVSRVEPFASRNVADLGDIGVNPADIADTLERIAVYLDGVIARGVTPLSVGGDHLISYAVLRSVGRQRPVGLVQFDAHTDLFDSYFNGFKYTHGTPFRRAIEEGFVDPRRMVQIGIRGTMFNDDDIRWGESQGVRIIRIEEVEERGIDDVMAEARSIVGDLPTYVTFDIDSVDPAFAPGTGTPEVGGFTSREAQRLVRRLDGLNLVGADLVEVAPPFDNTGATAWLAASLLFELLCALTQSPSTKKASSVD